MFLTVQNCLFQTLVAILDPMLELHTHSRRVCEVWTLGRRWQRVFKINNFNPSKTWRVLPWNCERVYLFLHSVKPWRFLPWHILGQTTWPNFHMCLRNQKSALIYAFLKLEVEVICFVTIATLLLILLLLSCKQLKCLKRIWKNILSLNTFPQPWPTGHWWVVVVPLIKGQLLPQGTTSFANLTNIVNNGLTPFCTKNTIWKSSQRRCSVTEWDCTINCYTWHKTKSTHWDLGGPIKNCKNKYSDTFILHYMRHPFTE